MAWLHRFRWPRHFSISLAAAVLLASLIFSIQPAFAVHAQDRGAGDTSVTPMDIPNCIQPPANADLTTLDAQQLAAYGLPEQPSGQQELSIWREMLAHAKQRICHVLRHNTAHSPEPPHDYNNRYWAGNIGTAGSYSYISAEWILPCLNVSNSPSNSWSSAWVGLGGYPGTDDGRQLIQSGSDSYKVGSTAKYQVWLEDYAPNHDSGNIYPNGWTPHCGDAILAVDRNDFNSGTTAYMYVGDLTQGTYLSQELYGSSWTYKSNISADWIVEGHVPLGQPLADFHQVTFVQTYTTQAGNPHNVGNTTHTAAYMCSDGLFGFCSAGSTRYAHPGPIVNNGNDFPVYWDHS